MFGTPFKQRAHYVFNYKPRYYSERKERLGNLKGKYAKDSDGGSSKRLAIIIALLVGICAYLFELHTLI
jgi:hypothetical protein